MVTGYTAFSKCRSVPTLTVSAAVVTITTFSAKFPLRNARWTTRSERCDRADRYARVAAARVADSAESERVCPRVAS